MEKNRLKYKVLPVVFLIMTSFPMINNNIHVFVDGKDTENRALAEKPEFDFTNLDAFPKRYDAFYNDHFTLRNNLTYLHSSIAFYGFGKSPIPEKAFVGLDGFLFMKKNELEIYRGTNLYTKDELVSLKQEYEYRVGYLRERKIKYYLIIAPIKPSIYPEYIPLSIYKINSFNKTDQLVDLVKDMDGLTLIDLRQHLINSKGDTLLYYKTDNHLNELGAFYACQEINKYLVQDFPNIQQIELDEYSIEISERKGGNIARIIGMEDDFKDIEIKFKLHDSKYEAKKIKKRGYPVPPSFPYKSSYEIVMKTKDKSLPKALIVRDSYGNKIFPFLSRSFSESVYIFDGWHYKLNKPILKKENPDVFIQIGLEAFQDNVLDNTCR